ncbi:putative DCC family thiol-disulfide oxidoreductase YuxK [Sphingomonas jejuensis]|uniref:DCC family thiol-disulfide oxidoreductase YuxK n=1 Tax=Sphingomonas jejuensis TaxID=904715 RepID=A0ABX0XH23_9SPHN|nr:DCC1-like thiol-disulfide oxidoreductase family protein [Sphingomonas jejuensis]NJC32623.1 putative DCC family thiol-disulfide oxidoreductase YuxK [Sphingomonas jejuensis]
MSNDGIWIVYDGECPFCSAYVKLVRLRDAVGKVRLVDARSSDDPIVGEMRARGFDLNQGMAMKMGDEYLHGDAVIHRLALMSGPSGTLNRVQAWVFRSRRRSALLYPIMRAGRNATLKLMGRRPIPDPR